MKRFILLSTTFILFISCSRPSDCIESSGPEVSKIFDVTGFDKIVVFSGIAVEITQGPVYKVEVKTGENLIDNIEVSVSDNLLTLKDNTSCNWVREYGQTVVYITTPTLTQINSKTEKNITSNGVLTFPSLHLLAIDIYDGYSGTGTGDYFMQINNDNLTISSNNVARFVITGQTNTLNANVYESNGTIEAQNLMANDVHLYHRGSNDMKVHPINSISGDIYNIGNVYSYSRPAVASVVQHYQGELIYN